MILFVAFGIAYPSLIALFCTFSSVSLFDCWCGDQTGEQYSRCGRTRAM